VQNRERSVEKIGTRAPRRRVPRSRARPDLLAQLVLLVWSKEDAVSDQSEFKDWLKQELDDLRRMRDELRVQAHLGRAELRKRWETLERSMNDLDNKAKRAAQAAEPSLHQLEQDVRKLAADLRDGYRRVRDAI